MVTAPEGDDGASSRGAVRLYRGYRAPMGTPEASGPEVLGQGREPDPDRPPPRRGSPRSLRGAWLAVVAVALVVGGGWYAGRPDLDGTTLRPGPTPQPAGTQLPTPDATALVSGLAEGHDLAAPPAPALNSFIASAGHVLLFLQIRNVGTQPLRIVDGVVPQDGASRDLTAGGLAAGTSGGGSLAPGNQTEVFVRLSVRCPQALTGPAAAAVLLVAEQPGRHPRLERVPTDRLGSLWDEARRAACRRADLHRDVTAAVVPGSVRAALADDGSLSVSAVLAVHDAAGFAAVLTGPAVSVGGGGRLVVDGGSTRAVPLRWDGGRCGKAARPVAASQAPTYHVELPELAGDGVVDLGRDFTAAWTARIRSACSQPG